jgi:hypothetical protein
VKHTVNIKRYVKVYNISAAMSQMLQMTQGQGPMVQGQIGQIAQKGQMSQGQMIPGQGQPQTYKTACSQN